jgi:hypothetical protein
MRPASRLAVVTSLAILLVTISCSQLPSRIQMTELDPSEAANRAIEQYDRDGDGILSTQEFSESPGLAKAQQQIDRDGDGSMTEEEIAARLQFWMDRGSALYVLPVKVTWRGQALADATVRFVPEEFLGEAFRPAEAVTDHYGVANMVHAPEDRPDPEFPQGVRVGLYRVEINKAENGKEIIPPKYNKETTLGQEVAADAAAMGQGMVTFNLQP